MLEELAARHPELRGPGRPPRARGRMGRLPGVARPRPEPHWARRLGLDERAPTDDGPSVRLLRSEGDENDLLAALLFEAAGCSEADDPRRASRALDAEPSEPGCSPTWSASGPTAATAPAAASRPALPLRDRLRLRRLPRPAAPPDAHRPVAGADPGPRRRVPEQVELAGLGDEYRRALEVSAARVRAAGRRRAARAAPYALCLGYRIRYVLDLNAREAMQLIELRSGREGHPELPRRRPRDARPDRRRASGGGGAMTHVDRETEPRLERILSEMRTQARRRPRPTAGHRRESAPT